VKRLTHLFFSKLSLSNATEAPLWIRPPGARRMKTFLSLKNRGLDEETSSFDRE